MASLFAERRGRPPTPDPDITDQILDLIGRGASTALEAAEPVFDIMARPQTALSEAYGAYKDGEENELLAAMRGLTEGWEGAKYGTFGEQLIPEEAGEGLGRAAARFGVDVATDPLNLLMFTGAGRNIISKGLQKAVTPALKKTAAVVKRQPWAQGVGRWTVRPERLWGMFGDSAELGIKAGSIGSKQASEAFEAAGIRIGKVGTEFEDRLTATGLSKSTDKRKAMSDFLEGKAAAPDQGVKDTAAWMRMELDRQARDAEKLGFTMLDPRTGKTVPFRYEPNYVPRMFKRGVQKELDDFIDALPEDYAMPLGKFRSGSKESKLRASIAKQLGTSEDVAERIVREYGGRPIKVGHLETARTQFPKELEPFLERDPAEWFVRYMERTAPRIEMARKFGADLGKLDDLLAQSKLAGMSDDIATDIRQMVRGVTPKSRFGMDDQIRGALAIQTMGKLGPTTSLMNYFQRINTAIKEGFGKMLRSTGREFLPGERRRHAFTYVAGLRDHYQMMTGAAHGDSRLARWAQGYLRGVLFTPIEQTNRVGSGVAGFMSAEEMVRDWSKLKRAASLTEKQSNKLKKLTKSLDEYGVPKKERENFLRMESTGQVGKLSEPTKDLVSYRASQIAQHATSPWELPPAWRTPEMRLFLQFKRFAYNQSRFMYEQVAKPAYRWFETNGLEGDIMPMARAMMLFPPAGVAVGTGREGIKDLQAWFMGAKRRPSQYDFDNHPTASTLRGMMYVGSFGVAGDLLERAYRSGLSDYFLGPTVSDLFDVMERVAKSGMKVATEGEYPSIEEMMLGAYRVAGRGPVGLSPTELTSASTSRGLPGAISGAMR